MKKIYSVICLLLGLCLSVSAQTANVLRIPDATATPGKPSALSVYMDNASEVVGLQFTVSVPQGMSLSEEDIVLDTRGEDHIASIKQIEMGNYLCMVYSPTNKPLRGYTGKLFDVSFTIADSFTDGSVHPMALKDVVLGDADANNVMTSCSIGSLQVIDGPDLTVHNIVTLEERLTPGATVSVAWTIANDGGMPTTGGWKEQVSLVGDNGKALLLGTVYNENILSDGGQMSRSATFNLPQTMGLDGNANIQVKVIANADAGESTSAAANNTAVSDVAVNVGKLLFIELPTVGIDEDSKSLVKGKLLRSGSWAVAETFTLSKSADDRVDLPATVTIPKGQSATYFYMKMVDNEVLDDDSVVTISASGNGYEEIKAQLIVVDNEYPDLTITAPKYEIAEGENFQLQISVGRVSSKPVTLYLTCDRAEHFKYPAQVTLPAGVESVTVDVTAIEDNLPNVTLDAAFAVKASRYNSSECYIELLDNDLPEIALTLTPNAISESAGPTAVMATLKRLTHNDNKVTIKLTDNSNGRLYYSTQTIVLESGVSEAQFMIGAIDNAQVDGEQEITVTAAIYISSCDCAASGTTAGVVAQTIKVLDDDGPALQLSLSKLMLLEGAEEAAVLTVTRNTDTANPLTVTLTSDADDLLTYEKIVTIPAGKASVSITVAAKANDTSLDSRTVVFTAKADDYTDGTCWAMITDQTLPDAVVTLSVDKAEIEAEEIVGLKVVVKNIGVSTLLSTTPVEIAFSGANENVKLELGKSILPNDSVVLTYDYRLPAILGDYTFEATVNSTKKIKELIYVNNRSERVAIKLISRFSVTANTDKKVYQQGDSVVISGTAIGGNGKNAAIDVYVINDGYRQTLKTYSDVNGNYRVSWLPLLRQAGHFIVGACYPGANATGALDEFDVYGISAENDFSTCEFSEGENYSGKIVLYNLTNLPQTGLQVVAKGTSENCEFSFDYAKTINANQSIEVRFTIKGNNITEGKNWQQMPIEITTAEGSKLTHTLYYFVLPLKAKLMVEQTSINTTMTYGVPREYPIMIRNVGKGETGRILLALPDWIQASTPVEMASLAQGDSATIVLRFMPTDEMRLNMSVRGKVGINCNKGDGTYINFTLTPVSEAIGKLKIDVVDEYTYNTQEAPHVSNAKVEILHPSTNEVVTTGITNQDGIFTTELPEGWYTLKVKADRHDSYSNLIMVDPGVEKTEEVFLSYQAITYSWDVVETEIEDEYEIETIVKYETNVPKPVIIVSMPDKKPEINSIFPIILTNQGLVSAIDVQSSISVNKDYTLEFLNGSTLDVLAPGQSHVFYVIMKESNTQKTKARSRQSNNEDDCLRLVSDNNYKHNCDRYKKQESAKGDKSWGNCFYGGSYGGSWGGSGGGSSSGPGYPSLYRPVNYGDDYNIDNRQPNIPKELCDDKNNGGSNGGDKNNGGSNGGDGNNGGNDGGNGDNGNPPDEVPDGETPEDENCDEEPKLVYELIPVDGSRKKMKGVAADGVSQVKIVLDPSRSVIPSEKCGWTCQWTLENDNGKIGKLENTDSWDGVIYTAPEDFPNESKKKYVVKAKITYTNGDVSFEKTKDIVIIRVPVLFVHGLNDAAKTMRDNISIPVNHFHFPIVFSMINYLKIQGLYDGFQLLSAEYKDTNKESFDTNNKVVHKSIEALLDCVNSKKIIASKVDVIGHSMGGLLTKKYIKEQNGGDRIHKLITLNTPHGGSQLGNLLNDPWVQYVRDIEDVYVGTDYDGAAIYYNSYVSITPYPMARGFLKQIYQMFAPHSGDISEGAVADLSVGGSAIENINDNSTSSVKCHAIVSASNTFVKNILYAIIPAFEYPNPDKFLDDLFNGDRSDIIVPLKSQEGGLNESQITKFDGGIGTFHCSTPVNSSVQKRVSELLKANMSSIEFSDGFRQTPKLYYGMSFSEKVKSIYTEMNAVLPSRTLSTPRRLSYAQSSKDYSQVHNLTLTNSIENDTLMNYKVEKVGEFSSISIGVMYKDNLLYYSNSEEGSISLPKKIQDDVIIMYEGKTIEGLWYTKSDTIPINTIGNSFVTRIEFVQDTLYVLNDLFMTPLVSCFWSDGQQTLLDSVSLSIDDNSIASLKDEKVHGIRNGTARLIAKFRGMECSIPIVVEKNGTGDSDDEESNSICSTITLSFDQRMVMTRQAFRGTLTVNNGHEANVLQDLTLNLEVRDDNGTLATTHEFQINAESLDNFDGELNLDAGWSLDANETGVATILFIPTKYAAPTEPKDYSFGGTFSYTDPYNGLTVTRELNPVTLTVKPSPNLEMTYFMQRDILGDDALTTDVVEPMEPAEFSLLINNVGYGDATNVRMVTEQPKIIENEKGLLIDFELLSSQLNGGEKTLAMGGSVPTEFGTIPAHSTAYAQWWIQSTLLGHFTEYDIKATHVTSYGNEDLSLLDTVTIHELIRSIKVPAEENKVLAGFLVNDITDAEDMPDMLYLSDGVVESVSVTSETTISKNSDTEYLLTVTPMQAGWNYGSLVDPTYGKQDIVRIVRQSDGAEINLRNIWQTDRTLRDGKDPLYESRIHFVDKFGTTEGSYLLTFEPKPEKVLEVESFVGVPKSDVVLQDPLTEITVHFNKPIDAATFTAEDLTLNCQGKALDVSQIMITQVSNTEYKLDLSALSVFNGYYVLTVQTAGIVDNEEFAGEVGKTASWIQYIGGKVNLMIKVTPDNAGTVTPAAGLYDYEETVTLTATASEGYEFLSWSYNDEVIATTPTHEWLMEGDAVITATFAPKNYNVEIVCDENEGAVTGAGTGVYQFGNVLNLKAEPLSGYMLDGWYIADTKVAESSTYVHTVDSAVQIEARFTQVVYDLTLRLENGWNWISAYFAEEELMTSWRFLTPIKGGVERFVSMETEIVNDPEYGLTGNLHTLSPTEGYKVKTTRLLLNTWTGVKANADSTQIALKKGWNWIGYPAAIDMEVNEAFANTEPDNEDYIVGQDGFAQYADGEWIGTLETLETGKGYMYHSKSEKEFTYNTAIYAKAQPMYRSSVAEETPWNVDKHKYPNVMCLIAELFVDDTIIEMEDCIVGAFCGDECRGIGHYVNGRMMMNVYGDKNEGITFLVMDNDSERIFDVVENVPFAEALLGTVNQPYPLHISGGTGVLNVQGNWRVQVENGNLYLSLYNKMVDRVTLTDVYGNTVLAIEDVASGEPVNISTLLTGVYIVTAEQDGAMYYKKIMKVGK